MKISLDELTTETRSLEEVIESPTIIPTVGRCIGVPAQVCGQTVLADDPEYFHTPLGLVGGCCVPKLLNAPLRNPVPERAVKTLEYEKVRDFKRRPSKVERAL